MKAVGFNQFGGPEVLEIVDLPGPHPGPGQVRIAVRAAGVNPSDWKKRKGLMDGELPQTMGHEAAGVVDELGEGVADVAVGDRVFGFDRVLDALAELFAELAAEGRMRVDDPALAAQHFAWLTLGVPLDRGMFYPIDETIKDVDVDRMADAATRVFLAAYASPARRIAR